MHPTLTTAVKAARRAGQIITRASQDVDHLKVSSKRQNDFVTEVDRAAEDAIIGILREAYPDHAILAEESGATNGTAGESEYRWIIDPLDGTTNFIHGMPQYAVSIALEHRGLMQSAVVFDPVRNELFTASRGRGAFLNDRRIRVSRRAKLAESLVGTGFPYRVFDHVDAYLGMFRDLMEKTSGLRRPGAAALDLAYVACGRFDAFFEIGLSPWDIAAGALLVTEAGGLVGNLTGETGYLESGNLVAATPRIFPAMLAAIEPHLTDALRA
ncbi:MAG: inositol monophosphatase [Methyloversatilis sp.]|jgi:myo-inositol-1(or 4)-monophosphatase|nr:inositol monophosphatase [Methyloversatilis sp.]MBP6195162.1 inositol monophosphatase [Methyloversatilis sp.]MBP9117766.1 inositol monophosphatase [Methyloversatilis sp.]